MDPLVVLLLLVVSILKICNCHDDNVDIYSCPRIHKAWHLMNDEERGLFIEAFHLLNKQGKISHFGSTHHNLVDQNQAHFTAAFFPWHRYLMWEFENQVRSLGSKYECFAIPYWDISHDSGLFKDAAVLTSGLGGIGDIANDDCVDVLASGAWSRESFPLQHICHTEKDIDDNVENGCCLKRRAAASDLSSVTVYTRYIKGYVNYGAANGFRETTFLAFHGQAHGFIGGVWQSYTHMISRYSPEDPIFWLLHQWLDYMFVVWKNCWGYNVIASQDLDNEPQAYFAFPKHDGESAREENGIPLSGLDDKLYYNAMDDITWWQGNDIEPTPRMLWAEADWNMAYERGTFIEKSKLSQLCDTSWDDTLILTNSESTKSAIRSQVGLETDVGKYAEKTWLHLRKMMQNTKYSNIYDEKDYLQTWHAKTCNFRRQRVGKEPCYVPLEYETCNDDDIGRNDISIDELLNKEGVKDNVCLEEVRTNLYSYAKSMNMLYDLCMGTFDEFNICPSPIIDFMIDDDDDAYYNKLRSNQQLMNEERISASINGNEDNNVNENDNNEKITNSAKLSLQEMKKYPKFDTLSYLLLAFVIGGIAFIITIKHCCNEFNTKLSSVRANKFYIKTSNNNNKSKYYGTV